MYKNIEAEAKSDFLIKKLVYLAIGFTTIAEQLLT